MGFYQVPKFIFNPIRDSGICEGSILLPTDFDRQLAQQVRQAGLTDLTCNFDRNSLSEPEWWEQHRGVDWVIAITQGMGDLTTWVTEYGHAVAKQGLIILDRLTFLEPTRRRERFLKGASLTNLKILSPRPGFRGDGKQLKDSVTSAWFVFKKHPDASTSTMIEYEVGWPNPPIPNSEQAPL